MKVPRWTLFWIIVVTALVVIEVAEITRLFTLPPQIALLSPYSIIVSLVLITILALVGAVFVGFYLSSQIYSARGFTPFEQEMLRMRQDVLELRSELRAARGGAAAAPSADLSADAPPRPPAEGGRP
jgi:hypothetical protein